ncbi:unnamed protein product [marine sediment metagenome]|uniref:Uncharacterized protein n=1 Tax=marine sediment metagenome TaxID=412755 RepID=X0TMI0_9ZZZZ
MAEPSVVEKAIQWVAASKRIKEMEIALTGQRGLAKMFENDLRLELARSLGIDPDTCGIQPGCEKSPGTIHLFVVAVGVPLVCQHCDMQPVEAVQKWKQDNE